MFCISCGAQLPDDAIFCFKCGKPQRTSSDAPTPTSIQGRWEYQEFSESIIGHPVFTQTNMSLNLDSQQTFVIDTAVKSLLTRLLPEGWEPIEPIDAHRLLRSGRLELDRTEGFPKMWGLGERTYKFVLKSVSINFRRWVSQDKSCDIKKSLDATNNADQLRFTQLMEQVRRLEERRDKGIQSSSKPQETGTRIVYKLLKDDNLVDYFIAGKEVAKFKKDDEVTVIKKENWYYGENCYYEVYVASGSNKGKSGYINEKSVARISK